MPTIGAGQVAIFYSLSTGALLGKLVLTTADPAITFATPTGQGVLIQSANQPYDDVACYALIAANTSFTPNEQTDRCVVLDATGTVIAVHKRDPAILPVQPGEAQLMLHPYADVGDVLAKNGKSFSRRCVHVKILPPQAPATAHSGQVTNTDSATVTTTGVTLPSAANKTEFVHVSQTLQVGDAVDLTNPPPGLATIIAASGV